MKKILTFIIVGVFFLGLVFSISFIQADPPEPPESFPTRILIEDETSIGNLVGENFEDDDILVENVLLNREEEFTIITFKEQGSVNIKGKEFNNILSDSEITIDCEGNILEANLIIDEVGGEYTLKSPAKTFIFHAPANSRVFKEKGKPPKIFLSENSNITLIPENKEEIIYSGKYFNVADNQIYNFGGGGRVEVTTFKNDIVKISGKSALTLQGVQHLLYEGNLNFYYDENFDASQHQGENYFNYGKNKISLGGKGFRSSLQEDTEIFKELIKNKYSDIRRRGELEFILDGGDIEISKVSPENHPLALDVKSSGKIKINNGNWILEADGKDIYANIEPNSQFSLSSDMQVNYQTESGKNKIYELDSRSTYKEYLSDEKRQKIELEINELNRLKHEKYVEIDFLLNDPEGKKFKDELNEKEKKLSEVYRMYREYMVVWGNAKAEETSKEEIKAISDLIEEAEAEAESLESEIIILQENPINKKIMTLEVEINNMEWTISDLQRKISSGNIKAGIWGQTLSSQDTDTEVSYSEFIEGFPVIKNVDVKAYYGYEEDPETGEYNFGRYSSPRTYEPNLDILDLEVDSRYQTCADTQVELYSLWQLQELEKGNIDSVEFKISNGQTLKYNSDGTYTVWSQSANKVITKKFSIEDTREKFDEWVTNVQIYSNTGSLRGNLKKIKEIDDLKAGDLITLHPDPQTGYGHTKAIKRVLRIPPTEDGEIYYQLFAGSDPAIDPRIYSNLMSKEELLYQIQYEDAVALTWK